LWVLSLELPFTSVYISWGFGKHKLLLI
jgi:hypothetical protein